MLKAYQISIRLISRLLTERFPFAMRQLSIVLPWLIWVDLA